MSKKVKLSEILKVKTGKYDANHEDKNGEYDFFTCALKPSKANTFSFDDEVIILPGNGANVGEVIYHNGKLEAYQRTYVLHEIKCNVKYLYYILKSNWKKHTLKNEVGSATNYIKLAHITDFKIPFPSIEQQNQIAKTLDKANELIELRKESITKLDALAKSIFIDMFGDPVSNPKGWEIKKILDLGKVQTGNTPPRIESDNYGDFIEWIKSDNILKDKMIITEAREYLSEKGYRKGRIADKGSLLFTCIAGSMSSIGNLAMTDRQVTFNQQINSLTPFNNNELYSQLSHIDSTKFMN
jgi:type I restriction enzyme S subunit